MIFPQGITLWLLFFFQLHLWKLSFNSFGNGFEGEPRPLLSSPIPVNQDVIVTLREDAPELVVLSGPGLNVTRINCLSDYPSSPVGSFSVPGADIAHFYDAFVSRGFVLCSEIKHSIW